MLAASCSSSTCAPTSATAVSSLTEALHCLQAFFVPFIRSGKFPAASKKKAAENLLKGGWIVGQKGTEEDGKNDRVEAIYRNWEWIDILNSVLLWCGLWMAMPSSLLSGYYHELAIKLENELLDFRNKCLVLLLSLLLNLVLPSQMAALHSVIELVKNEISKKFNNKLYFKRCCTLVSSPPSQIDLECTQKARWGECRLREERERNASKFRSYCFSFSSQCFNSFYLFRVSSFPPKARLENKKPDENILCSFKMP